MPRRRYQSKRKRGKSRKIEDRWHTKELLYQRQDGQCVGCFKRFQRCALTFDHVHPFSKGGPNALKNLQLLCVKCNVAKGDQVEWHPPKRMHDGQPIAEEGVSHLEHIRPHGRYGCR